jgi:hypothetical protein
MSSRVVAAVLAVLPFGATPPLLAQLDNGTGLHSSLARSSAGARLISAGVLGAGGAQAALAGSYALSFQQWRAGVGVDLFQQPHQQIAGSGTVEISRQFASVELLVKVGGGAAADDRDGASAATIGAALRRAGLRLSITSNWLPGSASRYRDSVVVLDSTVHVLKVLEREGISPRVYIDTELSYRLAGRRLEWNAAVGQRSFTSGSTNWWVRAGSTYAITPTLGIGVSIGRDPGTPWRVTRPRTFGALFLRVDLPGTVEKQPPSARLPVPTMRVTTDNATHFTVFAPTAKSVEITGSFNNWTPFALQRDAAGSWTGSVVLRPGVYFVSMRVDGGAWLAPPGLPAITDEFGTTIGLFEISRL